MPLDEDGEFIPKYNGYRCLRCEGRYLTVDLALGVTPMFMSCLATEGCGGKSISMGYPAGTPPLGVRLLLEWIEATPEEIKRKGIRNPDLLAHFAAGGLMRRAVDTAPQWVKDLA